MNIEIPKYCGACSSWLWESEQKDIAMLQSKYEALGHSLTLSQSYDIWYMYCDYCSANWMSVSGDISKSLMFIDDVLLEEGCIGAEKEYKYWEVEKINKSTLSDPEDIISVKLRNDGNDKVLSFKWDGCVDMHTYCNGFTPDDEMTREQRSDNVDYIHICELERHIAEMQEVLEIAKDILGQENYDKNFKYV